MKIIAFCVWLLALAPAVAMAQMAGMPGMTKAAVKTGKGTGVITALDVKAAKVTIKHGPIPSVGWPAMTMTFRATPPTLLKDIHVGQAVAFGVRAEGASAEVTAIHGR